MSFSIQVTSVLLAIFLVSCGQESISTLSDDTETPQKLQGFLTTKDLANPGNLLELTPKHFRGTLFWSKSFVNTDQDFLSVNEELARTNKEDLDCEFRPQFEQKIQATKHLIKIEVIADITDCMNQQIRKNQEDTQGNLTFKYRSYKTRDLTLYSNVKNDLSSFNGKPAINFHISDRRALEKNDQYSFLSNTETIAVKEISRSDLPGFVGTETIREITYHGDLNGSGHNGANVNGINTSEPYMEVSSTTYSNVSASFKGKKIDITKEILINLKNDYLRVESSAGLTGRFGDLYFVNGTKKFQNNNWTGTMTYDDKNGSVKPLLTATNGKVKISENFDAEAKYD